MGYPWHTVWEHFFCGIIVPCRRQHMAPDSLSLKLIDTFLQMAKTLTFGELQQWMLKQGHNKEAVSDGPAYASRLFVMSGSWLHQFCIYINLCLDCRLGFVTLVNRRGSLCVGLIVNEAWFPGLTFFPRRFISVKLSNSYWSCIPR